MARIFALIESGKVHNVITADAWSDGIDVTDLPDRPAPGWAYDGTTFTRPAPIVVTEDEIERAGLLARMTPLEVHVWYRAAQRAGNTNTPTVTDRNALYAWLRWESMRGEVDLSSEDVRGLASVWIALGMTQARAAELLQPLVQ